MIQEHQPQATTSAGWVHDIRKTGSVQFIILRTMEGLRQLTITDDCSKEVKAHLQGLTKESAIVATGRLQPAAKAPGGTELLVQTLSIVGPAEKILPFVPRDSATVPLPKRLDFRSLDLRSPDHQLMIRVQSAIVQGIHVHLAKEGFKHVFTPCLMGVPSESGSAVFPVIYFDKEVFLRQDPQLHRQLTIASGVDKIYEMGPAWRAEQSHTTKHLCEHRVCAVEVAFIKDEYDVMRVEEGIIRAAVEAAALIPGVIPPSLGKDPFPIFTLDEVRDIVAKKGHVYDPLEDLDKETERVLWEYVRDTLHRDFYMVTGFASRIKPFYVMEDAKDPRHARSFDVYCKGMELSSGGQREHRHDHLLKRITSAGMSHESLEWFTRHFRFGVPPHGGFAIGIERLTQMIVGAENIRDCVLFPRDPERVVP